MFNHISCTLVSDINTELLEEKIVQNGFVIYHFVTLIHFQLLTNVMCQTNIALKIEIF